MLKIIHTSSDAAVAQHISDDFTKAGYEVGSGASERGDVAIVLLSPEAIVDQALQNAIIRALDLSLHIIPVEAQPAPPPLLIAHLGAVDFSDSYDFASLKTWVDSELAPDAAAPLRVLTPTVRRSNRGAGVILGLLVLIMFMVGLYAVGVLHIQAPIQEFNGVDTMAALTRDIIAAPQLQIYSQFLPLSTDAAAHYDATLRAVPSPYRPLMAGTATAVAGEVAGTAGAGGS